MAKCTLPIMDDVPLMLWQAFAVRVLGMPPGSSLEAIKAKLDEANRG